MRDLVIAAGARVLDAAVGTGWVADGGAEVVEDDVLFRA